MTKATKIILSLPFVKPGDAPEIVCTEVPIPYLIFSGMVIPNSGSAKSYVYEFVINGDVQTIKVYFFKNEYLVCVRLKL